MVEGINNVFKTGQKIELQNRETQPSGITFELKSVFDDLAKQGIIKDKDGKGLTKQDVLNLYNMLNQIHQNTGRTTNYTTMQAGQSFDYSADEMKALAEAAGYEISGQEEPPEPVDNKPVPSHPELLDKKDKPVLKVPTQEVNNSPIELPDDVKRAKTEGMIEALGGKIIQRSVNGDKQDIAVVEIDGQKIRREINDDGTLGDTIAATKTSGKNKYISGDFPPETKVLERVVNGQKQQIGIYEDENGNKVRRLVENDPETGKPRLGENLVLVSSAGKNKYITQSKMDEQVRSALGIADNEAIPEDIKPEFISIGGEPTIIFKKDGKTLSQQQVREYVVQIQEQRVEKFDTQMKQNSSAEINDSNLLAAAQFNVINDKFGDKQGNITPDEYFNYEIKSSGITDEQLAEAGITSEQLREYSDFNFNVIDADGNGEITKEELKTYIDGANANNDNLLSADEVMQYGSDTIMARKKPNIDKAVADGYTVGKFEGSPIFIKDGKQFWMNMDGTPGNLIEE